MTDSNAFIKANSNAVTKGVSLKEERDTSVNLGADNKVPKVKKEKFESSNEGIKSIQRRFCSTKDHLDKVLDYLDNALKATVEPTGEAFSRLSAEDVPMDVDKYVTKDVVLGNQVSGFDSMFQW